MISVDSDHIRFADDIVLISGNIQDLPKMQKELAKAASKLCLETNTSKIKTK